MSPSPKTRLPPNNEAREMACLRPAGKSVMFQSWRNLLFLHWTLPPESLTDLLPPGLHLDIHAEQAWLGIVPFFMCNVRPRYLPAIPGISNFLELNVRTYVYDDCGIPGVWFFSLDANRRLACKLGRSRFHLPYQIASMNARCDEWIDYRALRHNERDPACYRYRAREESRSAEPGSLEFFLLERYVLYSHEKTENRLWRGRVHHKPYRFHDVELERFSAVPLAWNQLPPATTAPIHACVVPQVDVEIFRLSEASQIH